MAGKLKMSRIQNIDGKDYKKKQVLLKRRDNLCKMMESVALSF